MIITYFKLSKFYVYCVLTWVEKRLWFEATFAGNSSVFFLIIMDVTFVTDFHSFTLWGENLGLRRLRLNVVSIKQTEPLYVLQVRTTENYGTLIIWLAISVARLPQPAVSVVAQRTLALCPQLRLTSIYRHMKGWTAHIHSYLPPSRWPGQMWVNPLLT